MNPECIRDEFLHHEDDDLNETTEALYELRFDSQMRKARDLAQLVAGRIFNTLAPTCTHLIAVVINLICEDGAAMEFSAFL